MSEELNKLGIGQIALVKGWLESKELPFSQKNIKRLIDFDERTEAFEIILDKELIVILVPDKYRRHQIPS